MHPVGERRAVHSFFVLRLDNRPVVRGRPRLVRATLTAEAASAAAATRPPMNFYDDFFLSSLNRGGATDGANQFAVSYSG